MLTLRVGRIIKNKSRRELCQAQPTSTSLSTNPWNILTKLLTPISTTGENSILRLKFIGHKDKCEIKKLEALTLLVYIIPYAM